MPNEESTPEAFAAQVRALAALIEEGAPHLVTLAAVFADAARPLERRLAASPLPAAREAAERLLDARLAVDEARDRLDPAPLERARRYLRDAAAVCAGAKRAAVEAAGEEVGV